MINIVGYVGGLLFAFCAFPQVLHCRKQGHARGMSHVMLWMWFFGELLTIWYVWESKGFDGPLMFNYFMNLVFVIFIMKYKYWEVDNSKRLKIGMFGRKARVADMDKAYEEAIKELKKIEKMLENKQ